MKKPIRKSALSGMMEPLSLKTKADKKASQQLNKLLSRSYLEGSPESVRPHPFSIEKSDFYHLDALTESEKKAVQNIEKARKTSNPDTSFKVFRREVPLRDSLVPQSVAEWSAGSKVDETLGPFQGIDGRQFWFDFFRIGSFTALYKQGIALPVLLFQASKGAEKRKVDDKKLIRPQQNFKLPQGGIWINARLLSANAPAGSYTGMTIKGGTIKLSQPAKNLKNKLTVPANTTIVVSLQPEEPADKGKKTKSPFGKAAASMRLNFPNSFDFSISGNAGSIEGVGRASWSLMGQKVNFSWAKGQALNYHAALQRIQIPFQASAGEIDIKQNESDFNFLSNKAAIEASGWLLPLTQLDLTQPTEPEGAGQLYVRTGPGLVNSWVGLQGSGFQLSQSHLLAGNGQLLLADFSVANPHASQSLELWKEEGQPIPSRVALTFPQAGPLLYISHASGSELLMRFCDTDFQVDRPVKVDGTPPLVKSRRSLLVLSATAANRLVYLYDDNLIADTAEITNQDPYLPEQMALAMSNALFKVTQPNGCLLFGQLNETFAKVSEGSLFLSFGLLAYIPTLPDPYAANLGLARNQFGGDLAGVPGGAGTTLQGWLVGRTAWSAAASGDKVLVSFHFSPLDQLFGGTSLNQPDDDAAPVPEFSGTGNFSAIVENPFFSAFTLSDSDSPGDRLSALRFSNRLGPSKALKSTESSGIVTHAASTAPRPLPDYGSQWEKDTSRYRRDAFALLDVSTNADLFGISFDLLNRREFRVETERDPTTGEISYSFFSLRVQGLDVVSAGQNIRAFTVPQISWEPVINLSPPLPPPDGPTPGDPAGGFNYYPDDGGPTRIANNSDENVVLAPLPLTDFLLEKRKNEKDFQAFSFFTLPFGMKAAALLTQNYRFNSVDREGGNLRETKINFDGEVQSGLQLRMDAGTPLREGDSRMFMGSTLQINNVLDILGNATGNSTLGGSVTEIFNREFYYDSNYPFELYKQRGVPVTRMDLSGYGANMFSNWLNTKAAVAETSQAKFDVMMGRCSHEIIQVKSILYPWAIKVVRTITLFRVSSGYVYRFDSGWRAESDGKFDFRYYYYEPNPAFPGGPPENPEPQLIAVEKMAEFDIHPGLVRGLYNVSNIVETQEVAPFNENVLFEESVDQLGMEVKIPQNFDVSLQAVYFDADVEIEGVVSGMQTKPTAEGEKALVPSSRILGFVQLGPKGFPLNNTALKQLVQRQGTIGGPIDCEVELVGSSQKMRFSHFDFNNSFDQNGTDPVFCVAGRGNVLLPKDGSWSMVRHERSNGDVSPVPPNFGIPVIRNGKIVKDGNGVKIDTPVANVLTRIAEPLELLRQPVNGTVNYGFLQSTDTQKALLLTPAFQNGVKKLLSKTPPLFVDAFRIVNTKGIFPNIGAGDDFSALTLGEAILMKKNGSFPFNLNALQDLGQDVFELMDIQDTLNNVKEQGLQLLHNPEEFFDLPTEFELIDVGDGNFRIYIEYDKKDKNGNVEEPGSLDFDINSVTESWKSKMNNIGLVIDLAGIERLMTIRGNWDSENGKEATYPKPDLEFAPELDPLIDLLEILQSLQEGNYGEAVQNGLELAMSNKAGSWEYKFEASKEIPVIRFPVPDAVYNDPNTPFKLEAGLKIGAYFNAALKVTSNTDELLPSAGGVLGFYGRLSVMCVSVSAATIYAIGQAEVDIAADTQIGPSLRMTFGFGAQIVVGLPVAGNVSVLFVVGAEIFIAEGVVEVSAFLLFEGHAEILGGIVAITIRIEAKGTYSKKELGGGASRTDMQCQVTFGLDISIAFIINISFTESWQEQRRIA